MNALTLKIIYLMNMGIHCLLLPSPKHFLKNKNVEKGEYSSASWVFAELLLSLPSTPTCGNNHRVRAASMWPERRIPRPKKKRRYNCAQRCSEPISAVHISINLHLL